jgi:hypothetical protein
VGKHVSRGFVENIVREADRESLTIRQVLGRNPRNRGKTTGTG